MGENKADIGMGMLVICMLVFVVYYNYIGEQQYSVIVLGMATFAFAVARVASL